MARITITNFTMNILYNIDILYNLYNIGVLYDYVNIARITIIETPL
jgi:hypothetical protein